MFVVLAFVATGARAATLARVNDESAPNSAWDDYASLRDRFIALVRSLDDLQLDTHVPMCPDWTVTGVAAHVCGLNADLVSGMTGGLGTDERTARQVATRSGATIDEICTEWLGYESAMRAVCERTPLWAIRLAADLAVHLIDVQHALGLPIDHDDRFTTSAAHRYAEIFQGRVGEILGLGVAVELTDHFRLSANAELPDSGVVLRAAPFDFLRSYTARRSRRQVEALDWQGDPSQILDEAWSPYGTFQPDDVID